MNDPEKEWTPGAPPPEAGLVMVRWSNKQMWRWKEYKTGAPKHLLAKGGRWQRLNDYGWWENADPDIEPEEWRPA